jgi:hypothetical protein
MRNIHILPTDKPSELYLTSVKKLVYTKGYIAIAEEGQVNQNIYITNSEEIKVGDWILDTEFNLVEVAIYNHSKLKIDWKKIILTTDQNLIKNGVQPISDEFLEWFVKNPSCEEVEVREEEVFVGFIDGNGKKPIYDDEYKIIILKEEPKQETLEEVAERELNYIHDATRNFDFDLGFKTGCLIGYKQQNNNLYSEEDMIRFANFYMEERKNKGARALTPDLLIKQFKQK